MKIEEMEISRFQPTLFNPRVYGLAGCGANSLALLTGVSPFKIKNPNKKNKDDWTDNFVTNFLKEHKIIIKKICVKNEVKKKHCFSEVLTEYHLLLMCQLMYGKNASWFVHYSNLIFHNLEIQPLKSFDFLNMPILSCFALYKEEWK